MMTLDGTPHEQVRVGHPSPAPPAHPHPPKIGTDDRYKNVASGPGFPPWVCPPDRPCQTAVAPFFGVRERGMFVIDFGTLQDGLAGGRMKKPKAPETAMESVARSIGTAAGIAVRTAGVVADEVVLAAKKVGSKIPKKKARKKLVSRAKKAVRAGSRRVKKATRKLVRSARSSAKRAVSKRRKK